MAQRMGWWGCGALALLAGCGGPSVASGQARVQALCKQMQGVAVPATPVALSGDLLVPVDIPVNTQLNDALGTHVTPSSVQLDSLTLEAQAGIQDFSFLNALTVIIVNADGSFAPLMRYRPSATAAGRTLVLEGSSGENLVSGLKAGNLRALLSLNGTLPQQAWSVNARPCIDATVDVQY